jgi:hypothetical protein
LAYRCWSIWSRISIWWKWNFLYRSRGDISNGISSETESVCLTNYKILKLFFSHHLLDVILVKRKKLLQKFKHGLWRKIPIVFSNIFKLENILKIHLGILVHFDMIYLIGIVIISVMNLRNIFSIVRLL